MMGYAKCVDNTVEVYTEDTAEYTGSVAKGYQVAYDKESGMGGVVRGGKFYPMVPLNGHRARNLAEDVLGNRSAGEWTIDRSLVVNASALQELPGFDGKNQDYVDSFIGQVIIHVVRDVPSYGVHITIEQM